MVGKKMDRPATILKALLLLCSLTWVGGCSEEAVEKKEVARPIAWLKVVEADLDQIRRISGVLKAAETARLSFDVSGKIRSVKVNLGDEVKAGDILAELDESNFQLNANASQGQLQEAKAALVDAQNKFSRQKTLFDKGLVAKAGFDNALAELDRAKSGVKVVQAQLNLSRKHLADTALRAPYDGTITARLIEPSQRISVGERCFEIEGKQGLEISVMVPETLIGHLNKEKMFTASFPALPGVLLQTKVIEIGSQAEEANAFPVTLLLQQPSSSLRSGMSAEVLFTFEGQGRSGYQGLVVKVPPTAIMAGEGEAVYAFVYDESAGVVRRRSVQTENIINNEVMISHGLKPGEIIATAGVVYLHDGQKVSLLNVGAKKYN
ncbi:MAG: efflux RND transporter periplasmic adaptor subunit [Magnetococcales bacterium]|nr:efflux RND transporter periplasmic adaptor subunit [Magnetococcales bacterium]